MNQGAQTPVLQLTTPAQYLKGVGPRRAPLLARLGLNCPRDILFFFPRSYQDFSELRSIGELEEDTLVRVRGVVEEIDQHTTRTGRHMLGVLIRQENEFLRAMWFNQPYRRQSFHQGQQVLLAGKARFRGGRWEMVHPQVQFLGDEEPDTAGRILPVYPLTEGLRQPEIRSVIHGVVDSHTPLLDEVFPEDYLRGHQLEGIHQALPQIHHPDSAEHLERARRRFIYQELLVMQLALALRRQGITTERRAPELPASAKIEARIFRLFPFELTEGQRQACAEVAADMARPHPMNRLLQGDVGSGKTVVAIYAMLLAVAHGHQAALMVPTEVLARQHYRTLTASLAHSQVRIGLLVGSLGAAERAETLAAAAAGEVDLLVGTQALVQSDVQFARLGVVVIDEQHKFGVRQRASLRGAGVDPHYLVMTATPIPRTIALTQYGDLEVSVLRDVPPGRQPVHTYLASEEQRPKWWDFFRRRLGEGRQGFVIAPIVDQQTADELADVASVRERFSSLANGELADFRVDMLHGGMNPAEKEAAMSAFRDGRTQVLVASSVVEVGIDVPNATLMTIEGGQRFGLSQLHQMRGRVRRGAYPGYVCVFAESLNEAAHERLTAFCRTSDGFELAEVDFRLRGPGELFGVRQHGLPPLRIADLTRHTAELDEARRDAVQLVDSGQFTEPRFERLRRMVMVRYGEALELGDLG